MAAELLGRRARRLEVEIVDDDARALLGEAARDGRPDPARGAGDERRLALQPVHGLFLPCDCSARPFHWRAALPSTLRPSGAWLRQDEGSGVGVPQVHKLTDGILTPPLTPPPSRGGEQGAYLVKSRHPRAARRCRPRRSPPLAGSPRRARRAAPAARSMLPPPCASRKPEPTNVMLAVAGLHRLQHVAMGELRDAPRSRRSIHTREHGTSALVSRASQVLSSSEANTSSMMARSAASLATRAGQSTKRGSLARSGWPMRARRGRRTASRC